MMAARSFKSLFRGAGRNALDLPVAGLAALAAAFAAFAVPQDLLSRAVVATGLPSILSAAQPPLGLTARVGLAVVGAVIVFGLVFLLLRLLDRSGLNGGGEAGDEAPQAPRVRRRDGHPDAPVPRPISAARDLGEPAPPRAPRSVTPLWLDEAEPAGAPTLEAAPEPESAPEPEPEPAPEPVAEPWQAPEAVVVPEPEPDIAEATPPEPLSAPVAEPQPAPVVAPAGELPSSIAELMERLEEGLAKRRTIAPSAASATPPRVFPEPAAPGPQVFPEAADDRLQSAIASLQRLAARSS